MSETPNSYPDSQRPDYSDEISLVELVATFVRRRRTFYVVFAAVTIAGLFYAFITPDKYEYVSLIQVAQKDDAKAIQSPKTTIATLENRWLSERQVAYREAHGTNMPFEVVFSNPENTGLIRLVSNATDEQSKSVGDVHKSLISKVSDYQGGLVSAEQASLKSQIESLDEILDALKGEKGAGEAIAVIIEKRSGLELELAGLDRVEILTTSRQSLEKTAPKRSLIIVISILLGGLLGVFSAFLSEFVVSVKAHLADAGSDLN